uniref:Uncharacterized protein n=1 Tax=Trichuris muris TaxID=70415 RepID=A0A5S6QWB3_TRIMR
MLYVRKARLPRSGRRPVCNFFLRALDRCQERRSFFLANRARSVEVEAPTWSGHRGKGSAKVTPRLVLAPQSPGGALRRWISYGNHLHSIAVFWQPLEVPTEELGRTDRPLTTIASF